MTTATDELRIEMDEAIRQHPDLAKAAESASAFLGEFVGRHTDVFGEDRVLAWQFQPRHPDGERIAAYYSERDRFGSRRSQVWILPAELLDPMSRRNRMRNLLEGALDQRWKQSSDAIAAQLRELEGEE